MITLSTAPVINSVIGGNAPINYDKFVINSLSFDTESKNINATVKITSTTNPDMTALSGKLTISFAGAIAELQVAQLDFYRRIRLSGPQQNAVATLVSDCQDSLENGLLSLGLVAGTQATGA